MAYLAEMILAGTPNECFPELGDTIWEEDYSILGSILGSLYLWKLPNPSFLRKDSDQAVRDSWEPDHRLAAAAAAEAEAMPALTLNAKP